MAKITRKTQKLFGSTAGANKIAKFGSLAAGVPVRYTGALADPDNIQALTQFLQGWSSAVDGGNSPAIEDRNALDYLFSRQLAYILAQGVSEWDSGTTYYLGGFAASNNNIYVSIINDNLNKVVTDTASWLLLTGRIVSGTYSKPISASGVTDVKIINATNDQDIFLQAESGAWGAAISAAGVVSYYDVNYSPQLNMFAIAGQGTLKNIQTSSDGKNWLTRTTPNSTTYRGITSSASLSMFCAVGYGTTTANGILTSTNGSTWTARTSTSVSNWEKIAWNGTVFCAISSNESKAMTSPDGITWTARTTNGALLDICWASSLGLFVAVGDTASHIVQTSPDGITWTSRAAVNTLNAVCFSPELSLLVAVGNSGAGNRVQTSPDGTTWTTRTTTSAVAWNGVDWSPELGMFVSVAGTASASNFMYSTNGTTWIEFLAAPLSVWTSVCWSSSLGTWVAVSTTAGIVHSSVGPTVTTGARWVNRTPATATDWWDVTWASELGIFVAVSQSGVGNRVMTSSNGTTWTTRVSASDKLWFAIVWSKEKRLLVAVGDGLLTTSSVMTSPDGITWTLRTANDAGTTFTDIVYAPSLGLFIATSGGLGTAMLQTSPDGTTWTTRINTSPPLLNCVAWSEQRHTGVALGMESSSPGTFAYITYNGTTWTSLGQVGAINFRSVCYSPELDIWVAVGDYSVTGNASMKYSTNARTWTSVNGNATRENNIETVKWISALGIFVAALNGTGTTGGYAISTDGINWKMESGAVDTGVQLNFGTAYSPELDIFVSVGTGAASSYLISTITANPQIEAGKRDSQRITLINSDPYRPIECLNGTGLTLKRTKLLSTYNASIQMRWNANTSLWETL